MLRIFALMFTGLLVLSGCATNSSNEDLKEVAESSTTETPAPYPQPKRPSLDELSTLTGEELIVEYYAEAASPDAVRTLTIIKELIERVQPECTSSMSADTLISLLEAKAESESLLTRLADEQPAGFEKDTHTAWGRYVSILDMECVRGTSLRLDKGLPVDASIPEMIDAWKPALTSGDLVTLVTITTVLPAKVEAECIQSLEDFQVEALREAETKGEEGIDAVNAEQGGAKAIHFMQYWSSYVELAGMCK